MKRAVRLLKILVINALLLFLLLEAGSVAFYYWQTRSFFYTRNPIQDQYAVSQAGPNRDKFNEPMAYRIHPYFGYTYKPGFRPTPSDLAANNNGFLSNYDYPFKRANENQYIVGIFGGSVADKFWLYEFEHHSLANNLRKLPTLQNKEVIVLNFALPGGKQPQQMLILSYFLSVGQDLDLVINIDGYNEVHHAASNNRNFVEASMPTSFIELPMVEMANNDLSDQEAESILTILKDKARMKKLLAQTTECKLAFSYLLTAVQIKYYSSVYSQHVGEYTLLVLGRSKLEKNDTIVRINRLSSPTDDDALYHNAAEIWADSSLSMNGMLAQRHIPYFQFLQPNQYYSTGRKFSEAERIIAVTQRGEGFDEAVKKGYPILLSRIADLKNSNVAVFSAVNLFDNIQDAVYVDDCCHYNDRGNEVLSHYVFSEIKRAVTRPLIATKQR